MKCVRFILIVFYVLFILSKTLLFRRVCPEPVFHGLFWEVQCGMWGDIALNILLFIPLGFLTGGFKGLLICFCLSCGIEIIQYFGHLGYCEADDLLNNTIGAAIGAALNSRALLFAKKFKTKEGRDV